MRARVDVFGQVIVDGVNMLPVTLMEGVVVGGGRGKVREQVGKKQQFQPPGGGRWEDRKGVALLAGEAFQQVGHPTHLGVIFGSRQLDVVVVAPIADHLEERQQRNEFASVRAKDFGEEIAGHRVGISIGPDEGLRRHVDGQLVESRRHGEADAAAVGRAGPFFAPPLEEALETPVRDDGVLPLGQTEIPSQHPVGSGDFMHPGAGVLTLTATGISAVADGVAVGIEAHIQRHAGRVGKFGKALDEMAHGVLGPLKVEGPGRVLVGLDELAFPVGWSLDIAPAKEGRAPGAEFDFHRGLVLAGDPGNVQCPVDVGLGRAAVPRTGAGIAGENVDDVDPGKALQPGIPEELDFRPLRRIVGTEGLPGIAHGG